MLVLALAGLGAVLGGARAWARVRRRLVADGLVGRYDIERARRTPGWFQNEYRVWTRDGAAYVRYQDGLAGGTEWRGYDDGVQLSLIRSLRMEMALLRYERQWRFKVEAVTPSDEAEIVETRTGARYLRRGGRWATWLRIQIAEHQQPSFYERRELERSYRQWQRDHGAEPSP